VLVLASSTGAATAVFALVDAVFVRPLPFAGQSRLAVVWAADPDSPLVEISYPDFLDFRSQTTAFHDIAAHGSTPWGLLMTGAGDAAVLSFGAVSGSFFDVLGAQAQLGRTLTAWDDRPGAEAVVVLSHALWQQRFSSDAAVVGRSVLLDGTPHTIVGVMPPRFDYPTGSDLWAPLRRTIDELPPEARKNLRGIGFLYMVGRLRDGVSAQQAVTESTEIFRKLDDTHHLWGPSRRAIVTPLVHQILGPTRPALLLLCTAAALVLLLSWINVSGLALVRAWSGRAEIAVRFALGASRVDILNVLLAEAVLVSGAALVLALPISFICFDLFAALAPAGTPGIETARIDLRALVFAFGAVLVAAAFVTVQPLVTLAFRDAGRPFDTRNSAGSLRAGRSVATGGGRPALIAVQVALTVTVLAAAGLAVRSFWNLRSLDLGYEEERVLLVQTSGGTHPRVGEALAGLPGVRSVGGVSLRPLTLGPIGDDIGFQLESQTVAEARDNPALNRLRVTPGYFEAMGIRLVAGRRFDDRDVSADTLVAIVSEVTARALWGRTDVVGEKIRTFELTPDERLTTVVGVVASVHHRQVHEARLDYYVPTGDAPTWAVRTVGNPADLATAVRNLLREIDRGRAVETVTLRSLVAAAQRPWHFSALVLTAFSALALLLAATAVHGLVAFAVSLRTNEFGIRMALGATQRDIVRLVLQSMGGVALVGLLLGVPGALVAARAMRSLLFQVSIFDAMSLAAALVVLTVALVAACIAPGRRAARIDPAVALRAL
jgi:predicted permease